MSVGLTVGLIAGLLDERRVNRNFLWTRIEKATPHWRPVISGLIYGLSIGLGVGAIVGLKVGWIFGVSTGLIFGLIVGLFWGLRGQHRSVTIDIESVETLRWSWMYARRGFVNGLKVGWIFGPILGPIFGFSVGLVFGVSRDNLYGLPEEPMLGGGAGLIFGLSGGPFGGLFGGFFGGLRGSTLDIKAIPNLGIKLSMRNAVLAGGLGLLVFWLGFGLIFGLNYLLFFDFVGQLIRKPIYMLIGGLIFGLITFLWYGGQDVIQHYILRFILYWKGYAPLRYANFLDYAARLVFLREGRWWLHIHPPSPAGALRRDEGR